MSHDCADRTTYNRFLVAYRSSEHFDLQDRHLRTLAMDGWFGYEVKHEGKWLFPKDTLPQDRRVANVCGYVFHIKLSEHFTVCQAVQTYYDFYLRQRPPVLRTLPRSHWSIRGMDPDTSRKIFPEVQRLQKLERPPLPPLRRYDFGVWFRGGAMIHEQVSLTEVVRTPQQGSPIVTLQMDVELPAADVDA